MSTVAFTLACTFTFIACCPNCSELSVSYASERDGAAQTTRTVLARPPKADESSRVSFVSRKGGRTPPLPCAANAEMQRPKHVSELLMKQASSNARPDTSDFFTRSDPARSTTCSCPTVTVLACSCSDSDSYSYSHSYYYSYIYTYTYPYSYT